MGRKRESRISILKTLYDSVGGFERTLTKDEYFAMRWLSSKGLLNYCRQTSASIENGSLTFVDVGNKFVIKPTIFFLYLKYSLEFTAEDIYFEIQDFYREYRSQFVYELEDSLTDSSIDIEDE